MNIQTDLQTKLECLPQKLKDLFQANLTIFNTNKLPPKQQTDGFAFLPNTFVKTLLTQTKLNKTELGLALLPLAASYAVAPISNFKVGAVAFDDQNNVYLGANFEFSGCHIGQTIHAEQSAISHAWMRGAKQLSLLFINYPPCGHCRQFINEVRLTKDFKIVLPNEVSPTQKSLNDYLPDDFSGTDLGISQKILDDVNDHSEYHNNKIFKNDCKKMALEACQTSHAPYSDNKNGVALTFTDGSIIAGRYAENAAFNPSLPALQVALNFRRMQGKNWQNITKAMMVEKVAKLSQKDNTCQLLTSINPQIELEYVLIK
ncbi:cytidine deaminase [Psychrobacter sp. HD31]|uniref:cytidine deaminase n=1 Tax=Psychrobacter sp. HD31 TaxID=3112003 RepID=UPI003DA5E70F